MVDGEHVNAIATWRFGSLDRVGSFLDFAAGYGRSTRFLVTRLGPGRVCAAEIQPDALDFQARVFGVSTLLSSTDPQELEARRQFDVVFVASLFTHLPQRTFAPWLRTLWSFVAPGGMLVFSVHDEAINDTDAELVDGFAYIPNSEVASLSTDDYGTNFTTEAFVRNALREAVGEPADTAVRLPRALCFLQDVWVVCNGARPSADLRCECGPEGYVDDVRVGAGELSLRGWAGDRGFARSEAASHRVDHVSIYHNGALLGRAEVTLERPDVAEYLRDPGDPNFCSSGWEVTLATRAPRFTDVLTVIATCEHGAFPLDSARLDHLLARCGAPDSYLRGRLRRKLTSARVLAGEGGARAVINQVIRTVRR